MSAGDTAGVGPVLRETLGFYVRGLALAMDRVAAELPSRPRPLELTMKLASPVGGAVTMDLIVGANGRLALKQVDLGELERMREEAAGAIVGDMLDAVYEG